MMESGRNDCSKHELQNQPPIVSIVAVVIGRNEGERLYNCIMSLRNQVDHIIYVDSGSTDQSMEIAQQTNVHTICVSADRPYSAARARNTGHQFVQAHLPKPEFIQFVDGDCEVEPEWVQSATDFLIRYPDYAIVCGRRREKNIEQSRYNRFCDIEWDTPTGDTISCGGDMLIRRTAFEQSGGFDQRLIAGEEPEMCVRLRALGWKIYRLDSPMTRHDANMVRLPQWWNRMVRSGYAFIAVQQLHRKSEYAIWQRETLSAILWPLFLPLSIVLGMLQPLLITAGLIYPIQVIRIWRKSLPSGDPRKQFDWAFFLVLGKFAEGYGVLKYCWQRLFLRDVRIIEYK